MSSNTLRGVGQGGDGDGGDEDDSSKTAPVDGAHDPEREAQDPSERRPELRRIRSLDSTVPGTRSLDSSVPDAAPSLDAKVPNMAATLLGLPAPVIIGRDQGTVQGRDVHLPAEAQRNAGLRPVAGVIANSVPPTPRVIADSEPVPVSMSGDPPRGAVAGPKTTADGHLHVQSPSDIGSNPWYDDDLASHRVYEDNRPNVLGRVAIGAAVAAALSVVLFAFVRVYKANPQGDEPDTRATASAPAPTPAPAPAPAQNPTTVPAEPTAQLPPAPAPGEPSLERPPTQAIRPPSAAAAPQTGREALPVTSSSGSALADPRRRPSPARWGPAPVRQAVSPSTASTASSRPEYQPSSSFPPPASTLQSTATTTASTPAPTASVDPPPAARPPAEAAPPPTPTTAPSRPTTTEKRGKANYDPDSTLPLNID